jgi:acyl carrier protein
MSSRDLIFNRLQGLAARSLQLNLSTEELATVTRLDEVAGLDSLTILEFVAAVESEFGITFEPSEMRADILVDLPALAERISRRLGGAC